MSRKSQLEFEDLKDLKELENLELKKQLKKQCTAKTIYGYRCLKSKYEDHDVCYIHNKQHEHRIYEDDNYKRPLTKVPRELVEKQKAYCHAYDKNRLNCQKTGACTWRDPFCNRGSGKKKTTTFIRAEESAKVLQRNFRNIRNIRNIGNIGHVNRNEHTKDMNKNGHKEDIVELYQ